MTTSTDLTRTARMAAAADRLATILRAVATMLTRTAEMLDHAVRALGGEPTSTPIPTTVVAPVPTTEPAPQPEPTVAEPTVPDPRDEVHEALTALGYSARDARAIVAGLPAEGTVEDLLREALRRVAA